MQTLQDPGYQPTPNFHEPLNYTDNRLCDFNTAMRIDSNSMVSSEYHSGLHHSNLTTTKDDAPYEIDPQYGTIPRGENWMTGLKEEGSLFMERAKSAKARSRALSVEEIKRSRFMERHKSMIQQVFEIQGKGPVELLVMLKGLETIGLTYVTSFQAHPCSCLFPRVTPQQRIRIGFA